MRIQNAIHEVMGLKLSDYIGKSRKREGFYARMIFVHHCRNEGATVISIAKEMQHNHATVIYYLKKYQDDYKFTPEFRDYVQAVQRRLSKD